MSTDTNLQEPGADDEPFAQETGTEFVPSAYSDVLHQGLANIHTPVVPRSEPSAQQEAPRKKPAEAAAKHKHHHSKTKLACRNSPTKSKAPAAS